MAKDNFLMIYFTDVSYDDLGSKVEKQLVFNILESDYTISDIVKDGGMQIEDVWYPYHQMNKIIISYKEKKE